MERICNDCPPLVLVVDDDASVRAVGADILADAGFAVLEASDADEALRILAAHPDINVVFSDVEMPGALDGLALASRVSELCPGVGIVLTSGGQRIDQARIPRDGQFVHKPYAGAVLLRRIAAAMQKLDLGSGEPSALSA